MERLEENDLRERAIQRLKKKDEFRKHLLAYTMVNTFLVAIWAMTGAEFFWPVFPILGWGIGLSFHAWDAHGTEWVTEERIQREIQRMHEPVGGR